MANLAIKGHNERGKEVIEILEMLGGKISNECGYEDGFDSHYAYFIDTNENSFIDGFLLGDKNSTEFSIFTLEEFLEKYPYKVGDKAIAFGSNCVIIGAVWDESINEVVYRIRIDETEYTTTKLSSQLQPYKEQETMEYQIKINIPKGYEFAGIDDDNQQVVFEKIEYQYPKTYEECCVVLGTDCENLCLGYAEDLLDKLQSLLICRNAYWKIAGLQMGLGKPWEPDWKESDGGHRYCIINRSNNIIFVHEWLGENYILSFPTEEMRDAFFENFGHLIELCKELL